MKHQNSSRRSVAVLLGLAATGLGLQACGGDSTSSTSTTGGEGGERATTATTATTASAGGAGGTSFTTVTTGAGGAGGATATVGVGGAGGAGGATSSTSASGSSSASSTSASGSSSASSSSASSSSASSSASSSSASSSSASSSSASSSSASSSAASSSASTGTGGGVVCTEITLGAFKSLTGDSLGGYSALFTPNLGDAASYDLLNTTFYGGSMYDGQLKGTFNLGAGNDANYETCSRCFLLFQDAPSATGKTYFQQSGTLVVNPSSNQLNGTVNATINNLTLVEVTIDIDTFVSTPVPNGECLHVTNASLVAVPPVTPAAWTCDPTFYADGFCDCGCGVVDFDCATSSAGLCQYCDNTGSCSLGDCTTGTINPTNSGICTP